MPLVIVAHEPSRPAFFPFTGDDALAVSSSTTDLDGYACFFDALPQVVRPVEDGVMCLVSEPRRVNESSIDGTIVP